MVDRARLFIKKDFAIQSLDVICEISSVVSQKRDIDEIFANVLELAFGWVGADRGGILYAEQWTADYLPRLTIQREGEPATQPTVCKSMIRHALESGEPVVIHDLDTDHHFCQSETMKAGGVQQAILIPITCGGSISGFIYFDKLECSLESQQFLDVEQIKWLKVTAALLGRAIENHSVKIRLADADRMAMIGNTFTSLSHHIKNILQGIAGGAHIVADGLETGNLDLTKQGWGIARRNQDRLTLLIVDMLSSEAEREPELKDIDLNVVVESVLEMANTWELSDSIDFDWIPTQDAEKVSADPKSVFRAIQHLVLNAIEACKISDGGLITIRLNFDKEKREAHVIVRDNGCGISEQILPHVFSLFETSKTGRKVGIGLTVAQKFARDHNGEIYASSRANEGSEFTLVLPLKGST